MPKKTIQDIKIKRTPRTPVRSVEEYREEEYRRPERSEVKSQPVRSAKGSRYKLWVVAGVSLSFFLFALSYMFLRVNITVTPKTSNITLNHSFSAEKRAGADALLFDLMVISGEESKAVQAVESMDLLKKTRGTVVLYNNFSSAPQRLDVDTRLEGSNGKIYKTEKQVVVPGLSGTTPGSVEVGIYGAEAGEEYNSAPLDFQILGFKGTPKYTKFYGRGKGDITGGFKGKSYIIPEAERVALASDLKNVLETKLFKKASDQIPAGFILFKDAVVFQVDESNIDTVTSDTSTLPVKIKGTLYGFLFDESKLTKKITEKSRSGDEEWEVYLSNIRDLVFTFENKNGAPFSSAANPTDIENISFNLKGTAGMVHKVDEAKLATDLLGKSKKDFNQVLEQYPNIDSANLVIKPFWKMSFPDKIKDINIIVNYPK